MKRTVLVACGLLLLVLGAVGIAVPVMPTTPFVLAAAACFSSSSPSTYRRLLNNRFFGPYIAHFRYGSDIGRAARARGIIVLWVLLAASAAVVGKTWVWIVLAFVGVGVTLHLLLMRSKRSAENCCQYEDDRFASHRK